LRGVCRRGDVAGGRAPRADGRERHRMPRRRGRPGRGRPRAELHDDLRPAPQRAPVARPCVQAGRAAEGVMAVRATEAAGRAFIERTLAVGEPGLTAIVLRAPAAPLTVLPAVVPDAVV